MAAHTLPRGRLAPEDIESHGAGTKERISEMKLAAQFYEEHLGLRFESIKGKRRRVIVALVGWPVLGYSQETEGRHRRLST